MNNLAATMKAQGDLAGARKLQEEMLAIRRRVLGPEHPDTLTSMNNLADTLRLRAIWRGRASCKKRRWASAVECWGPSTRIRSPR